MNESNQIIELLNNENTIFKNISYKSVNQNKINNTNNNSFSNNRIRFNTKEISNHLVSYEDAYILLEVDIKFNEAANASAANIFFLLKTKLSRIYIAIIITKIKLPLKPCKFLKGCITWQSCLLAHNYAASL